MYAGHRVIVNIPSGRQRHMELLIPYLLRERNIIDEVHLWLNTDDATDMEYVRSLASDYVKVIDPPSGTGNGTAADLGRDPSRS